MKVRVDRQLFLKKIKLVSKAILDNKIRPIISGMYMEAKEGEITLKGTDLELTITSKLSGEVVEEGKLVFSYQLVEEYLKAINDKEVILSVNDNILLIETEGASSQFSLEDGEDYPKIMSFSGDMTYNLDLEMFTKLLGKAKFASSQSSENLTINCVRLELEDEMLKLISTDTYRLVYVEEKIGLEGYMKVSIPNKTVEALLKIMPSENAEKISLTYEGSQLKLKLEETEILTRLIDLQYPDYEGILDNTNYDKDVYVNVKEINNLLKRVQIFVKNNSESKNSGVFEFKENKMLVKGVSEIAKIMEELEIEKEGEDLKISLNVKFLIDYINFLEPEEKLRIKLSNSSGAVELNSEKDEMFRYLVMPLALKD